MDFAYRSTCFDVCQLWKSALFTTKIFALHCRLHLISERLWWRRRENQLVSSFLHHKFVVPVISYLKRVVLPFAAIKEFYAIIACLWIKDAGFLKNWKFDGGCSKNWIFWKFQLFWKNDAVKFSINMKLNFILKLILVFKEKKKIKVCNR